MTPAATRQWWRTAIRTGLVASLLSSMVMPSSPAWAQPRLERSVQIASGLGGIAASRSQRLVYVASAGERKGGQPAILVLDRGTLRVKDRIKLPAVAGSALALNERLNRLYVTDRGDQAVLAVDLESGEVVATIRHGTDARLRDLLVDDTTGLLYAADFGGGHGGGGDIWVIDGTTNRVEQVIEAAGRGLASLALDAGRAKLYATDLKTSEIVVIDTRSGEVRQRFASGGSEPDGIKVDRGTDRLFVANQGSGTLTVLDGYSGKLLRTIATGDGAAGVAFDNVNRVVYVTNHQSGTTTVVDSDGYQVLANLATGLRPDGLAFDSYGRVAYVASKAVPRDGKLPPGEDPRSDTISVVSP